MYALFIGLPLMLWTLGDTVPPERRAEEIPAPQADIDGYYVCRGTEGGKAYHGIVVIERRGEVYVVAWMLGNQYTGVGIRTGDMLSVAWAAPGEKVPLRGINVYRIQNKTLTGTWATIPGNGKKASETLTFLKALDKEEE